AVLPQPAQVRRRGERVALHLPGELQQGEGRIVAQVAVQASLVFPAVERHVEELNLGARQDFQGHAFGPQRLVEVGDVRQDGRAEQAQVAVAVRRGRDVADAVAHAEAGDGQGLVQRPGAVVNAGQDVAMEVQHPSFLQYRRRTRVNHASSFYEEAGTIAA